MREIAIWLASDGTKAGSMRTALDFADTSLNEHEKKIVNQVRERGWFCTSVAGDENNLAFTYTTGFWKTLGVAELLTFSLPPKTAYVAFDIAYQQCKTRGPLPVAQPMGDFINAVDVQFRPLVDDARQKHMLSSMWFYCGENFPCLQMVWPDFGNIFPWQRGFDGRFRGQQPDLSPDGWHNRAN